GHLVEPVEDVGGRLGVEGCEIAPPSGLDEEEDAPQGGAEADDVVEDLGQLEHVAGRHRGVDLESQAGVEDPACRDPGGGIDAGLAPEAVVGLGAGPVEGERHRAGACTAQLAEHRGSEPGCHRGGDRHREPERGAVGDELDEVGTLDGVAAREDDHRTWRAEAREVLEERLALGGAQLEGVTLGLGLGPTVPAGEGAGPRDLPDDDERTVGEVLVQRPDDVRGPRHDAVPTSVESCSWTSAAACSPERTHDAMPGPSSVAPASTIPGHVARTVSRSAATRPRWPTSSCGRASRQRRTWTSTGGVVSPVMWARSWWSRATSSSSSSSAVDSPARPTASRTRKTSGSARWGHLRPRKVAAFSVSPARDGIR